MFYTLQACACSMAMTMTLPPKGGGGGALEEAVVSANCRAVGAASAFSAAIEACSSLRMRAMACTRA
jgi:hypothetical protein